MGLWKDRRQAEAGGLLDCSTSFGELANKLPPMEIRDTDILSKSEGAPRVHQISKLVKFAI